LIAARLPASRESTPQAKLSKRDIDAAQTSGRDSFIWDTALRGPGVKVTPKGRKVYIVQYRLPGSATRRFTIAVHGSAWTPDAARDKALEVMACVARGVDPATAKRDARAGISVAELCELYLAEGVRT
jgi:hypothetical protein